MREYRVKYRRGSLVNYVQAQKRTFLWFWKTLIEFSHHRGDKVLDSFNEAVTFIEQYKQFMEQSKDVR